MRYYVCGIGYDEDEHVTDNEWDFGDYNTYEEAYERFLFIKDQKRSSLFIGKNKEDCHTMHLQIEKCKETKDSICCEEVLNEYDIINPKFDKEISE